VYFNWPFFFAQLISYPSWNTGLCRLVTSSRIHDLRWTVTVR